ncbi:MAG: enoyl-CoA hydratase-related protein [Beijerinckiaceae bacterium]
MNGQATYASISPRLKAARDGAVVTLTLNAPERRNCLDLAAWSAMPALIAAISADAEARVLILRGAGETAFCAGADIAEFETARATPEGSAVYERANVAAFAAVANSALPVIAAINGHCFGAGMGLAAACDIRIAGNDATFAIPAAKLGVGYPPVAMGWLTPLLGPECTKRLFLLAERLDAEGAFEAGFVSEIIATNAVFDHARKLADIIAGHAPMTMLAARRAIDAAAGAPGGLDTTCLQALADACFASADYAEGRAAFRDKRPPRFIGR